MNTVNQNPDQCACCACCGDGGSANLQNIINGVGQWGAVIAGIATGRQLQTNPKTGQIVGARQTLSPAQQTQQLQFNQQTLLIVVVAAIVLVFVLRR